MLAFLGAAGVAGGAPVYPTGEDVEAIRDAIHRQIDSPCQADARGAPDRPMRLSFRGLVVLGDEVVQEARLTDRRGGVWIAYYAMQRLRDGTWRMSGCHLVPPARPVPA